MQRITLPERPDWQTRADSLGFTWHHESGEAYWDDATAYEFSLAEIEDGIEAPTAELHQLCLDLVDETVKSERLMGLLEIPEGLRDYVADSWKRGDPSLYGRFDFAYDGGPEEGGGPARLYEYNADTPTSVYESAVFQWLWLEERIADGSIPADADQFNSLHEALIARFRTIFPMGGFVHFASDPDFVEDRQTVRFLEDLARQAGLDPKFVAIGDIGLNADGRFVDEQNWLIQAMFKLYPWEQMLRDDYAEPLPTAEVTVLEPAWKSILSNKGILPLLWERHAGHPNLLESYFEDDPKASALSSAHVRKPLFSREGANIDIVEPGHTERGPDGGYTGRAILQAVHEAPLFDGRHVIVGSWVVGDQPAGIGLREDAGRITSNRSRFVPHLIRD